MKKTEKLTIGEVPIASKMRIRLFNPGTLMQISDRLVDQATELRIGPKETHKGPMTLEFNLNNQIEVDQMVDYLKKLKGDLPIVEISKKRKNR